MGALVKAERRGRHDDAAPDAGRGRQFLTFMIGDESFAIAISSIKEIIEFRRPTDVPMMPSFMRGVINLRGHVVPVIDLSVRFGRAPIAAGRRTCIVIMEVHQDGEAHEVGAMVDSVSAVLEIADADIESAPGFGARLRADFIGGMGKVGERFVILLDTEKVFSIEELANLAAMAQASPAA